MEEYMVLEVDDNDKPIDSMKLEARGLLDAQVQYAVLKGWGCAELIAHEISAEGTVGRTSLHGGTLFSFKIPF